MVDEPRDRLFATSRSIIVGLYLASLALAGPYASGQNPSVGPATTQQPISASQVAAPVTVTLQDAFARARAISPQFRAALTELGMAREDRVQARAGMLPSVNYTMEYLYTQGTGTAIPRYIANNAVHEYVAQGNAHQTFNLAGGLIFEYRRAAAAEALARAKTEIATRGLVVTVVQAYYGLVVAERKYSNAQRAATDAERFFRISQQLQQGGEVAHSDVIKAQLQNNDRQRDLREAQLTMSKARLGVAVLLFADFNQNFTIVDDLQAALPLPPFPEIQHLAQQHNPDLQAAIAGLRVANEAVAIARSGHFPSLTFDYFYGIDASRFATKTDGVRNLGYSTAATLVLPIWSWGATQSKVKQADLRRQQARVELSFAQRQLLSNLASFYQEAAAAQSELQLLRNSAELAAESQRLTTLRYQSGEATVLEVVDAQNTLTQARNNYDDGEARYRVAIANLQTVTGTF